MRTKISLNQFYILMFISNILFVTYISSDALGNNFFDSIISIALAFIIGALLSIPIYLKKQNTVQSKLGDAFYAFYFIFSDIIILTQILSVFSNTIYYNVSPVILSLSMLVIAFYGAQKGIEAVSRAAFFIFIIFILSLIFLGLGLVNLAKADNSEVLFYSGYSDCFKNTWLIFSASSYLPQSVMLLRYLNKKLDYKFFVWQGISMISLILIFLAIVFCLGRFAKTQMYPFYSLFSVATLEPIQRMDNIFSLITLTFLTTRVSVDLILTKECFRKIVKKRFEFVIPIISAVIILCVSVIFSELNLVYYISNITLLKPVPIIFLGFILPLISLIKEKKQ